MRSSQNEKYQVYAVCCLIMRNFKNHSNVELVHKCHVNILILHPLLFEESNHWLMLLWESFKSIICMKMWSLVNKQS